MKQQGVVVEAACMIELAFLKGGDKVSPSLPALFCLLPLSPLSCHHVSRQSQYPI